MSNKQDKFFDYLRDYMRSIYKTKTFIQNETNRHLYAGEEIAIVYDLKNKIMTQHAKGIERIYKTYKDSLDVEWGLRLLDRMRHMSDIFIEIVRCFSALSEQKEIEKTKILIDLTGQALIEMKKIFDYTDNIEENAMKIEARMRKIEVFEERARILHQERLEEILAQKENSTSSLLEFKLIDNALAILTLSVEIMFLFQKVVVKE